MLAEVQLPKSVRIIADGEYHDCANCGQPRLASRNPKLSELNRFTKIEDAYQVLDCKVCYHARKDRAKARQAAGESEFKPRVSRQAREAAQAAEAAMIAERRYSEVR